jgi:hypothetical protein
LRVEFVRIQIILLLASAIIGGSTATALAIGIVLSDKMYTGAKYGNLKKGRRDKVVQSSVTIKRKTVKHSANTHPEHEQTERSAEPSDKSARPVRKQREVGM